MICTVPPAKTTSRTAAAREDARGDSSSEQGLFERARRGSRSAAGVLFERSRSWLRPWARGRLPPWARGEIDTSDLVQDAMHHTFARLPFLESNHVGALRVYLQHAVENRIRDRLRRAMRHLNLIVPDEPVVASDGAAPQHRQLIDDQAWRRYVESLGRLTDRERRLIVGRAELGYSYRQLAFIERLPSAEAARKALGRALRKLIDRMSNA